MLTRLVSQLTDSSVHVIVVNSLDFLGPRACYDEGKRVAETLSYAYAKQEKVQVRVARIFNTYGPRMHMNDGRVVSNFILQALQNESITVSLLPLSGSEPIGIQALFFL